MDKLVLLIPLMPLIAAMIIGIGHVFGFIQGEQQEEASAGIALWSTAMSALLSLTLLYNDLAGNHTGSVSVGYWLSNDTIKIPINFITSGISIQLAALFSVLLVIMTYFSIGYLHKEDGFHRFFALISLFSAAMMVLVLAGNAVLTFAGWELAGVCSYLLVAFAYDRNQAASNATRVYITNRIGDVGFIGGIGLCVIWFDSVDWLRLHALAEQLSISEATGIGLCFTIAALAKSAQLPFSAWLPRALEGPTPSSAIFYGSVMIHSGVFLILMIQPIVEKSMLVMSLLIVVGASSSLLAYYTGLSQTDIKSSLAYATKVQIGLMFIECGLGFWQFAGWHLCAHAVVRCRQFMIAPSLLHHAKGLPARPLSRRLSSSHLAFIISLHRFWIDSVVDWVLIKPINRLGQDLVYLDTNVIDNAIGSPAPAMKAISSFAQFEEERLGAKLNSSHDLFAEGSGLAGKLTAWFAGMSHWFENKFVLPGTYRERSAFGRRFGHAVNQFEHLTLRPRYLVLFVFITLLVAF